ncbi:MAG: hypothetical protein RIT43_2382 [Bacteroidota bacterium]
MSQEEKDAHFLLQTYLYENILDEQERENLEQFLVVFYFDILKKHSEMPFTAIVSPLIEKGMADLFVTHIAPPNTCVHAQDLRAEFLRELIELCRFSFGSEVVGDQHLELDNPALPVDKYIFTDSCSIRINSVELVFEDDFIPNALVTQVGVVI